MEQTTFFSTPVFMYVVMPLLIMLSRVVDVSIGTMRVIFVSRGYKPYAMLCGFFEVLIWLIAITQILQNLTNPVNYIAYATGFALGNFVGMCIEEKIALGHVMLSVVTKNELIDLTNFLRDRDYGVTMLPGQGLHGSVQILFTIIPREDLDEVVTFFKTSNPYAFYTIEDIRYVNEKSIAYNALLSRKKRRTGMKRPLRKGK